MPPSSINPKEGQIQNGTMKACCLPLQQSIVINFRMSMRRFCWPRLPRERRSCCRSCGNCPRKRRMWDPRPSFLIRRRRRRCQDRCQHLLPRSYPNGKNSHSNVASHQAPKTHARYSMNPPANGNISLDPSKARPMPVQNRGPFSKSKRMMIPWLIHGRSCGKKRRRGSIRMWSRGCAMPRSRARWKGGVRTNWSRIMRVLRNSGILRGRRNKNADWSLPLVFRRI
mmetsp:Transcript_9754/g.21981  ORF Transcript_9754/g.21981 Transcript_9754/m.21981 type:complete len:226 (+) Transcript_9754:408-1085(+)